MSQHLPLIQDLRYNVTSKGRAAAVAAHGCRSSDPHPSDPLSPRRFLLLFSPSSKDSPSFRIEISHFLVDDPKSYVHSRKRIVQIWCRSCKIGADPPKNAPGRNNRLRAHPRRGRKSSFATFTSSPCACENSFLTNAHGTLYSPVKKVGHFACQ